MRDIEALLGLVKAAIIEVNVCLPAVIESYANGRAVCLPTVKKRFADGDVIDYPKINNVRVVWPTFAGGRSGIKGKVEKGDKVILVFAQSALTGNDRRNHSLIDAFAFPCDLGNQGGFDNSDMVMRYGSADVRISEEGHVTVNTITGLTVNGETTINGMTTINGNTLTNGNSLINGMNTVSGAVSFGSGGESAGDIKITGSLEVNGIDFSTHTHSGVEPGNASTGNPQ